MFSRCWDSTIKTLRDSDLVGDGDLGRLSFGYIGTVAVFPSFLHAHAVQLASSVLVRGQRYGRFLVEVAEHRLVVTELVAVTLCFQEILSGEGAA